MQIRVGAAAFVITTLKKKLQQQQQPNIEIHVRIKFHKFAASERNEKKNHPKWGERENDLRIFIDFICCVRV